MKYFSVSVFVMLALLQSACSDDNGGEESSNGNRRLNVVKTTFSDGRVDTITYTYSAIGVLESFLLDTDGTTVNKTTYVYGPSGLVGRQDRDDTADGTVDVTVQFQYENGRLVARDYDSNMDQVADYRRITMFDDMGRYSGYADQTLAADGQLQGQRAINVVTYEGDSLVVSERDSDPLGSPDLRIEYMVLPTGEITSSVETYFTSSPPASVTEWTYEDAICDTRWLGGVFLDICLQN